MRRLEIFLALGFILYLALRIRTRGRCPPVPQPIPGLRQGEATESLGGSAVETSAVPHCKSPEWLQITQMFLTLVGILLTLLLL